MQGQPAEVEAAFGRPMFLWNFAVEWMKSNKKGDAGFIQEQLRAMAAFDGK
jgi:hypothetical protein